MHEAKLIKLGALSHFSEDHFREHSIIATSGTPVEGAHLTVEFETKMLGQTSMCLSVPGQLISIDNTHDLLTKTGKVSFGGITKYINLTFVPDAHEGDYVLVHVGFAIAILNDSEAESVFQFLDEIDEIENR